jgi:HEAT repeat protein
VTKNKDFWPIPSFRLNQPFIASTYPQSEEELAGTPMLTDQEALKKIGHHTSKTGRIVSISVVVGVIALTFMYFKSSDAYEHRMDGFESAKKFEAGSPPMLTALRATLESSNYDDVKVRAIRNLGYFKDPESVPVLIKALDIGGIVRRAAALAIAEIGSPTADAAKPKLLEVLPKCDAKDRPQVVWALAVLKERAATDAILTEFVNGLLQGQPGFDTKVIADAVGVQKLSSPNLVGHENKGVRTLVATALSETATADVVAPLIEMIGRKDEDSVVVRAAVGGLGRVGDPRGARALVSLMQARPDMRQNVIEALRRSTAAPQLCVLVKEAKDVAIERDLVRLLRKTRDSRAADTLASLIAAPDQDTRIEAIHGLAELGDGRAVEPLLTLARSEDDEVGTDAIDELRALQHPSAGPGLLSLLKDFPYRKAAILRALGASHDQSAGPAIEKELAGDDLGAATKALGELPYLPAYQKLAKMIVRPPNIDFSSPTVENETAYRNRYEAMQGLRYFGKTDPGVARELIKIVEDDKDDFRLVDAAGEVLGQIADEKLLSTLLEKIKNKALPERVRIAYVQGLWLSPNREFAKQLFPLFGTDTPTEIERAAALALGYAADPANDARLLEMLDPPGTRRSAAVAIVLGGGEEAARKLLTVLNEDRDLRDWLRENIMNNTNDNFNLIIESNFTSGEIYRRLRVAEILKESGSDAASYTYIWGHLIARLQSGWVGAGGLSSRAILVHLYKALTGSDAKMRRLSAAALASMSEYGLLLAARDIGIQEAREALKKLDKPTSSS